MQTLLRRALTSTALSSALLGSTWADVRITASGPVTGQSGTLSGAFASATLGDMAAVSLRVSELGVPTAPDTLTYAVLPSDSSFTLAGTTQAAVVSGSVEVFADGSSAVLNCECILAGGEQLSLILIDTTNPPPMFTTNNLVDLLGTVFVADTSNHAYQVNTSAGANFFSMLGLEAVILSDAGSDIGVSYCPGVPNSTGADAGLLVQGSAVAADNNLELSVINLPPNQFGYFLTSQTQGFFPMPGGSQGNLCLAGQIGRYTQDIFSSGAQGTASLQLDLTQTPTPSGPSAVLAGQTWSFQCWYRDADPAPTSSFSSALSVSFQ